MGSKLPSSWVVMCPDCTGIASSVPCATCIGTGTVQVVLAEMLPQVARRGIKLIAEAVARLQDIRDDPTTPLGIRSKISKIIETALRTTE